MNLSISSPRKPLITHNWKYLLGRNLITILSYSKLDHLTSWREWKIDTARGENRCWTSDIYTEKTPDFRRFKYSFNKRSLHLFWLYPWKNEKFNKNVIHWTITLITPLFGIVHFKTNYNYRLSNHCFINELILVTYALISNAVEKKHNSVWERSGSILECLTRDQFKRLRVRASPASLYCVL